MAKKRIYPNVISVRLTNSEKEKLEAIILQSQTNKSKFLRDRINILVETI